MAGTQLRPEKITHPFQLMAAWFLMLITLVASLLAAAIKIDRPSWAAGFLVVSAVVLAVLVMIAVFVMLTRFRPHLQGPREYAEWIKDERSLRVKTLHEIASPGGLKLELASSSQEVLTAVTDVRAIPILSEEPPNRSQAEPTTKVIVVNADGVEKVVAELTRIGFAAEIYKQDLEEGLQRNSEHEAIWIGSRVPPRVAIKAIKAAGRCWPHLAYLHLTSDEYGPDQINDEIFIGGSTSTAIRYQLQRWTRDEIQSMRDDPSPRDFRALIRRKYST
jgi:hypothetical protein